MLYQTKYEKQLGLIKLNEKIIRRIREYNTLLSDSAEIKNNNLKIKFYEAQTKIYRQKAKKLKNSPEGKEVTDVLSYNTFGKSNEELNNEQQKEDKEYKERIDGLIEQALKERMGE